MSAEAARSQIEIKRRKTASARRWAKLTPIENSVAREASTGATDREIASRVGISAGMVNVRLASALRKLGLKRQDLIKDPWSTLTPLQRAVTTEARTGATHHEIGLKLGIADRNHVRKCLASALRKLGVDGRKGLIQFPYDKLSPFQRRVAILVARGDAKRHIAQKLGVSENNVARNLKKIYRKVGVNDRLNLIVEVLYHQPAQPIKPWRPEPVDDPVAALFFEHYSGGTQ